MQSASNNPQSVTATQATALRGTCRVPGDKSISHRAIMLASQALGTTTIHDLLEGEDVLRTAEALRQCLAARPDRHPAIAFGPWRLQRQGRQIVLERS